MKKALAIAVLAGACGCETGRDDIERQSAAAGQVGNLIFYGVEPHVTDSKIGDEHWENYATDAHHVLYLNRFLRTSGRLLVFLHGADSDPGWDIDTRTCAALQCRVYEAAANQGYHVIALSYPTLVSLWRTCEGKLNCWDPFMSEVLYGSNCDTADGVEDNNEPCEALNIHKHRGDAIVNRLKSVLAWADKRHPNHGWDRYFDLNNNTVTDKIWQKVTIEWNQVSVAGHSAGSTYAAKLGLDKDPINRVVLFSGPNDGYGDGPSDWKVADWVKPAKDPSKFYGLVQFQNKMDGAESALYQVTSVWDRLGLSGTFHFDPDPLRNHAFFSFAHQLISDDPNNTAHEAHVGVIEDQYSWCDPQSNLPFCRIGYSHDAWPYLLGSGL